MSKWSSALSKVASGAHAHSGGDYRLYDHFERRNSRAVRALRANGQDKDGLRIPNERCKRFEAAPRITDSYFRKTGLGLLVAQCVDSSLASWASGFCFFVLETLVSGKIG